MIPWRRKKQPPPVFLSGESPWTQKPGRLQSMGSQRIGHDWETKHHTASVQFSSVAQPTLCGPVDCGMPGLPVHHQLPGFTQTHVPWVSDAIQPSHPLSSYYHTFLYSSQCLIQCFAHSNCPVNVLLPKDPKDAKRLNWGEPEEKTNAPLMLD